MKKLSVLLLCLCALAVTPCVAAAKNVNAAKTNSTVAIDGIYAQFEAYNIAGNNYFKLRDIAYVLNGSNKHFEVTWDAKTNSINLTSNKEYTAVGGELQRSYSKTTATPTTSNIYLDGKKINLTTYNIGNNNYFKLRDLGKALNFSVEWNAQNKRIDIETAYNYHEEGENTYALTRNVDVADSNVREISNWAEVSPVQQFSYMDKGLAYAYMSHNTLNVVTPNKNLQLEIKYPLLGDVISDKDGNIYVVWGKPNDGSTFSTETIFISKYSENGQHIKTTGFSGESMMGADGNTKTPFQAGNCSSAIHNDTLMVTYAREMYSGHQSNNVIGVSLKSMSPVKFYSKWDIPYNSHSFNQRVIWSQHANNFVYADHGDAYDRGFVITTNNKKKNIFNFYLPSNANYDMYIVNKTYAQLGGLAETSSGIVFVGASAKSISEKARVERQNLFVQIFKTNTEVSKSMFVGGVERSGATSFDINDNKNAPLTPVTNYGVHWITDHIDKDVIAPHAVVADDRIVILWNEINKNYKMEAFYTILSSSGDIIKAQTSLGIGRKLNSHENPIYHNGKICWASSNNGIIRVDSIDLS